MWRIGRHKLKLFSTITAAATTAVIFHYSERKKTILGYKAMAESLPTPVDSSFWIPEPRSETIKKLKSGEEYDILIIGGGATGAGCALDATTRGLKTALVEANDFACGTSSRSTKLIHGGVRYLEKAFLELDYGQYALVKEALHERGCFMKIAPHLAREVPIMLPVMTWWKLPYYYIGAKAYDLLAGSQGLTASYFLTKTRAIEAFPMLKRGQISGAIVYYDGMHNDSRMNVSLALTAAQHGAAIANHVEVIELLKKPRETLKGQPGMGDEELCGAVVRDTLTGDQWTIRAKGIINATGPFCDSIRKMDSGLSVKEIVAPSAGVHIVLPSYFSPKNMGLLDPHTSDGRVIFFLPWEGSVIAGTTDSPTKVDPNPVPSSEDINWILKEVENYLSPDIKLRKGDVQAAWSGIRPLVKDPNAKNTESLVRNHMVHFSESGLLTIAGGKWTTYRAMAEDTINKAVEIFDLNPKSSCVTATTMLVGSQHWHPNFFIKLIQHFGLETEVAQHLADNYGDRAWSVATMASQTGSRYPIYGQRIAMGYPFIEGEVRHACRRELACTAVDVIARRTRLAFLNAKAASEALPRVIDIMAVELGWDQERKQKEYDSAQDYLMTMGLKSYERNTYPNDPTKSSAEIEDEQAGYFARINFLPNEIAKYRQIFESLDFDKDGSISQTDFGKALDKLGLKMSSSELKHVISEVDSNHSGSVEYNEFLQVLAAVKDIRSRSKFARIVAEYEDREQFPTDRSGGGV